MGKWRADIAALLDAGQATQAAPSAPDDVIAAVRETYASAHGLEGFPPRSVVLADGTLGYHSQHGDDCLMIAVATVLQVPPEELPDLRPLERYRAGEELDTIITSAWDSLRRCVTERGLHICFHSKPLPTHLRRWIGVCWDDQGQRLPFSDHCLVMAGQKVIFDPSAWKVDLGVRAWTARQVHYGISFPEQKETDNE